MQRYFTKPLWASVKNGAEDINCSGINSSHYGDNPANPYRIAVASGGFILLHIILPGSAITMPSRGKQALFNTVGLFFIKTFFVVSKGGSGELTQTQR